MSSRFRPWPGRRRGQTTVEYMLVISVLVIAMFIVTELLADPFISGLTSMTSDVGTMTSQGYVGG